MKKIAFSFALVFVLTFTAFADGYIHTGGFADDGIIHGGGRSCPQNQTCSVESNQTEPENDNPIIFAIKSFINLF